jgi:hypothetical protein
VHPDLSLTRGMDWASADCSSASEADEEATDGGPRADGQQNLRTATALNNEVGGEIRRGRGE